MKNFDTRTYSVSDFVEWSNNGLLNLSPDFQRRAVWTEKAKSYLIDTLIRGKPIPKILMTQELQNGRNIRVAVDGQQRLRAILGFVDGAFKISRAHNEEFAGKTFEQLPQPVQSEFLQYELGVDVLFNMTYADTLDIFARINSYSMNLNVQEKLNAKYVGYFKQTVYGFGYRYVDYWVEAKVLTKATVTRMSEAELAADLTVALTDEVQTNKGIEQFYRKYEDIFDQREMVMEQFNTVMSYIGSIYPSTELAPTNWSRVPLFYTLFTSLAHNLYGILPLDPKLRTIINEGSIKKLRVILDGISAKYDDYTANLDSPNIPSEFRAFIDRSRRGTTDTGARVGRANFVCTQIKAELE